MSQSAIVAIGEGPRLYRVGAAPPPGPKSARQKAAMTAPS